jgi:arginine decarboxylase
MSKSPLLDLLETLISEDHAPFYMPGHKRGNAVSSRFQSLLGNDLFRLDLPELPGIDRAIAEAEILAARAYKVDRTWFLVNGSTVGIQAALLSICQPGEKVLIGRNAHKSAIAALILTGAIPIYLPISFDPKSQIDCGVGVETLEATLKLHADAKAVVLVSPNYFGVVGEIGELVAIAHKFQIPVIVDAAHGAHLAFHPDLPMDAIAAGADLVVHSTHKMATSLTQSSMLHLQGNQISAPRVAQALDLLQSSSPNLLLLTSLDVARQQMVADGAEMLSQSLDLAKLARSQLQEISDLEVVSGIPTLDPTRLTVLVNSIGRTGFELDRIFCEQFGVIAELPTFNHLVFAISIGNQQSDIQRLVAAFKQVERGARCLISPPISLPIFEQIYLPEITPRQAYFAPTETIQFDQSCDRLSQELICPYPPGIPIVLPGERISNQAIAYLKQVKLMGGIIKGARDETMETIEVLKK